MPKKKNEWGLPDVLWNETGGENLKVSVSWKCTHNTTTKYILWLSNGIE